MTTAPIFKVTDIHIRDLRGLQKLDLPGDGMGWGNSFPPVSVIGGANGSGKTTLLRCIARAAELLLGQPGDMPHEVNAAECRIDFAIADGTREPDEVRFLVGKKTFVKESGSDNRYGYFTSKGSDPFLAGMAASLGQMLRRDRFAGSTFPRLVFFPSDERDLVVPELSYKSPGQLDDNAGFVAWWQRGSSQQWNGSLVELLFSARWADLNAKEQGKPQEARSLERYTKAFADLTLGEKRLTWTTKGDLVIELANGTQHSLQELSSGERQALLLLAELRRLWRPGSLVLIDELELHLHDAWQGRLYDAVKAMQAELGGQVIITTQSHSLFEMAGLGTRALIGRGSLR